VLTSDFDGTLESNGADFMATLAFPGSAFLRLTVRVTRAD